jgi:hypothetical protein
MTNREITKKHSVILFVVCGKELLMQAMTHQGAEIYDVFGTFVDKRSREYHLICEKARVVVGNFEVVPFGRIIDYIDKPEARVRLETGVYKINLSKKQKNALTLSDSHFWAGPEVLKDSPKVRFGDRLIFLRALEDSPMNIKMCEDQYEKWIDAKLTKWVDA